MKIDDTGVTITRADLRRAAAAAWNRATGGRRPFDQAAADVQRMFIEDVQAALETLPVRIIEGSQR